MVSLSCSTNLSTTHACSQQYVYSNCWELNEQRRKINTFNLKYIKPNLKGIFLNVGEIFKTYRGQKHMSTLMSEYDYTYEPTEVQNRWEKQKQGRISRRHDVIHQIRTPIDTEFTMIVTTFNEIFRQSLKKDEPFMLNIPLYNVPYSEIVFQFDPLTDYEYTFIVLARGGWGQSVDDILLRDYIGHVLVIPDNGFCASRGALMNLKDL